MKQAKASQAEWQKLVDWFNAAEENGMSVPPWHRVVFGYDLLVTHCADPAKNYLDFKPGMSPNEVTALRKDVDLYKRLLAQRDAENAETLSSAVKIEDERNALRRENEALREALRKWYSAQNLRCQNCDDGDRFAPCSCFENLDASAAATKALLEFCAALTVPKAEPLP